MKPKVVEAKRCVVMPTIKKWYKDGKVIRALKSVRPRFLYNGDETSITTRAGKPEQCLGRSGFRPTVVVDDRTGLHVSLFIVVSAEGEVVRPSCILHGPPQTYLTDQTSISNLRCFRTENGYMTRDCFYRIMTEVFIPFVENERRDVLSLGGKEEDTRAVLIVDGHKSRYDVRTLRALQKANVTLIILPAHSSHITQPLDLRLNGMIKTAFSQMWNGPRDQSWSRCLIRPRDGKVPTDQPRRKRRKQQIPVEEVTEEVTEVVTEGNTAEETDEFVDDERSLPVSKAEYDRFMFLDTIRCAIRKLNVFAIRSSWRQSNLHPFKPVPPTSKAAEKDLLLQLESSGFGSRTRVRKDNEIPLTGVINSPEDETLIKYLEKKNVEVLPTPVKQRVKGVVVRHCDPESDVGDIAYRKKGNKPLLGHSDAVFVIPRKNWPGDP